MKISVVIPAYNAAKYLRRSLDSVLYQTRKADEIIVVDDGSNDKTAQIAGQYQQQDKIQFIHQSNAGASVARNTGIKAASSEWIAFLDADDQWLPEKLQIQSSLLERNPHLQWTAGNFHICDCSDDKHDKLQTKIDPEIPAKLLDGKEYFEEYFDAFTHGSSGWTGTMLITRSALENAGLFRPGQLMSNDIDLWWRLGYQYRQIGYSTEPLAIYHSSIKGSITDTYRQPEILLNLVKRHLALAEKFNRSDAFEPCAGAYLRFWLHKFLLDDRIKSIPLFLREFKKILPVNYRIMMRTLTLSPALTKKTSPLLRKLNRILKLPV